MLLEKLVRIIAPHICLNCQTEGQIVCTDCLLTIPRLPDNVTVPRPVHMQDLIVYASYEGLAKELVQSLKFKHCSEVAEHIAQVLYDFCDSSDETMLVPVRTSLRRYRQRGYDQTVLITRYLSRLSGLPVTDVLMRSSTVRQLGARRSERLSQLKGAYSVRRPESIRGRHLLLIDDVVTTGATLESAASALHEAGAASVRGLVFAQAIMK